jgi:hypothetical protein
MPEPEPKVLTEDVQTILRRVVQPDTEDEGDSVALIASKADTSTRTVYRVLASRPSEKNPHPTIKLDLADRLCIAADSHLWECRLVYDDGRIEPYF